MPTTYEQCGDDVEKLVKSVINQYHHELKEAGVSISLLFARNSDGDPVKLNGYPCAAVVKKNSLKDRAEGKADATITIDEYRWNDIDAEEQRALIDHELYHLIVKRDKANAYELDDLGRPKLLMRLHDAQIGIFKSIIERHGMKSLDAQFAENFIGEFGQLLLWAKEPTAAG